MNDSERKLAAVSEASLILPLEQIREQQSQYIRTGLEGSANTVRGYAADLKHYMTWCQNRALISLPLSTEVIGLYLTQLAGQNAWATISRRLAALRKWHALHHGKDQHSALDDPAIQALLKGIQKTHGVRQKQAPAFDLTSFKQRLAGIPLENEGVPQLTNLRDKALLLLGFVGAFRRSELIMIDLEHLRFDEDALVITLPKSKTNQKGEWEEKAVFFSPDADVCPVRTLKKWIKVRELETGLTGGPLFVQIRKGGIVTPHRLSDKAVDRLVKAYLGRTFSAHSLRASFVTVAKLAGAEDSEIMQQTKHKTTEMIRRYTRVDNVKKHNAAKKLNL